jgi:hypothetical protein
MTRSWSCFERDQLFGAHHDAYSTQWSGYSVANPEYESKEMYKAVSWAVHSSQLTQDPTLTVFILPAWREGSHTAYLKWTETCPANCRLLATIPRRAFKFIPPETNTMGQDAATAGHPDWDINLLLVGNTQGFTQAFGPSPDTTTATLKKDLIRDINAQSHPKPPSAGHSSPTTGPSDSTPRPKPLNQRTHSFTGPTLRSQLPQLDTTQDWALHPYTSRTHHTPLNSK